jgi:hypothetical protein
LSYFGFGNVSAKLIGKLWWQRKADTSSAMVLAHPQDVAIDRRLDGRHANTGIRHISLHDGIHSEPFDSGIVTNERNFRELTNSRIFSISTDKVLAVKVEKLA